MISAPKRIVNALLGYDCVYCGEERWIELREARVPGFKFVCARCDKINTLQSATLQIVNKSTPKVSYNPKSTKTHTLKIDNNDNIIKHAISVMHSYGYNKKDAATYVNAANMELTNSRQSIDEQSLIKTAFVKADKLHA